MRREREPSHLLHQLLRPPFRRHPDEPRRYDVGDGVQTSHLVAGPPVRSVLGHGYAHAPHLLEQGRTGTLLLDDETVGLPVLVLVEAQGLELGELHPPLDRVQQDDVVGVSLFVEEHAPRGQRREVRSVVSLGSGVQRHDDVLHRRWVVLGPQQPPLALHDGSLFAGRVLLILRVPLEHRH